MGTQPSTDCLRIQKAYIRATVGAVHDEHAMAYDLHSQIWEYAHCNAVHRRCGHSPLYDFRRLSEIEYGQYGIVCVGSDCSVQYVLTVHKFVSWSYKCYI